ncbi:MAG: hypothetical protein MZU97_12075 [Bacillus subtilis]|nr:hypothetical protein [Bacillus subtilis]
MDKDLTVFFSDIRGFTTLSENMTPQELVNHLNIYLTAMTDLIHGVRRHPRQVHRRRDHVLLGRAAAAAGPRRPGLQVRPQADAGARGAQRRLARGQAASTSASASTPAS